VWRLGRPARHLANSLVTLGAPCVRSTTRVLRTVRTSVKVSQMHKWRTLPHVGSKGRIPQQNLTFGQQLRPHLAIIPQGPSKHEIVLPSLHRHHLPHRSTRRAQCQRGPRSFQEHLKIGSAPYHVHESIVRRRPLRNVRKDLLEKFVRQPEYCGGVTSRQFAEGMKRKIFILGLV